jgi:hypothetical protein
MFKRWILLLALCVSWNVASANEGVFYLCNVCDTPAKFQQVAESNALSLRNGEYDVVILNDLTNVMYDGYLWIEQEPGSPKTAVATIAPSTTELKDALNDFKAFYAEAAAENLSVIMPPSTWGQDGGGGSFSLHERWSVGAQIVNHPSYLSKVGKHFPMPGDSLVKLLYKGYFLNVKGEFPRVVVIFGNGDVALFDVTHPFEGAALAIQYVEGSARDRFGNVLSDGSGKVTGGSYVRAGGNGGIRIHNPGPGSDYVWLICSRVGGGPWTCIIEND